MQRALFISDTQIPFEVADALPFLKSVVKEFRIEKDAIFHVGDEIDCYHASFHDKDPDALHSPASEIAHTYDRLKAWYKTFPELKLAISNHGLRWAKKASKAGIPKDVLKGYRDILKAPAGWRWQSSWLIKMQREPVYMFHGMGYSGVHAYRQAAIDKGMNVVFGHLHSNPGISHIVNDPRSRWGMVVGSLIDHKAYAFNYAKDHRFQPWLGVGVVIDGGITPLLIPYERMP